MRRHGEAGMTARALAAALLTLGLAACAADGGSRPAATAAGSDGLPDAERLDVGLLMVPVARDSRGCVQYRLESEQRPAVDALFYRTRAGDFSTIEEEAACT